MEGPSVYLAAELISPFIEKKILKVEGNTKINKELMHHKKVFDIFSWGKHLVLQFDTFALRIHFLLWGSFEATVHNKVVTGDYPKKNRTPRLALSFKNGHIEFYSCSLLIHENPQLKSHYDFSTDIMSDKFDRSMAFQKGIALSESEIGDILLDQSIFSGVGNIMKNEVLFSEKISPEKKMKNISAQKFRKIIKSMQLYAFQFYEWRKVFELRKHYQIYRKGICPICQGKVSRKKTGQRQRFSFICPHCQK